MKNNLQQYVCLDCIGNEDYKTFIKEEGDEGIECDYCKIEGICITLDLLADQIDEEYRANYEPSDSGDLPSDIISVMLELDDLPELREDLVAILSDSESRDVSQGADALYDNDSLYGRKEKISYGNVAEHHDTWGYFCRQIKYKTRFFNNELIKWLDSLFSEINNFKYENNKSPIRIIDPSDSEATFYRARCATDSQERICTNPSLELGPPPEDIAYTGRMNPVGVSVFYGAFERKTCIAEIRLPVGETAISGQFKLEKKITVLDLTVLNRINEPLDSANADDNQWGLLHFLKHFSAEISEPVQSQNANLEYLPTQAFSEYLANYYQTKKIDAIIYPSAQTNYEGKNIVILNHAAKVKENSDYENDEGMYLSFVSNSLMGHKIKAIDYDIEDYDVSPKSRFAFYSRNNCKTHATTP